MAIPANARRAAVAPRRHFLKLFSGVPHALDYRLKPIGPVMRGKSVPKSVLLLRPDPNNHVRDQLFVDRVAVPRAHWRLDPHDRTLTWRGAGGGGHLKLTRDHAYAMGVVGAGLDTTSVAGPIHIPLVCDIASDAGVRIDVDGANRALDVSWDPTSAQWNGATWASQALQLNYTITPGADSDMDPDSLTIDFLDPQTSASWDPGMSWVDYYFFIDVGDDNLFHLDFDYVSADPLPEPTFPVMLRVTMDQSLGSITGAMLTGKLGVDGTPYGLRGAPLLTAATGYYEMPSTKDAKPLTLGLFNGRAYVDNAPLPGVRLVGDRLVWKGLPAAIQARTGLAPSGAMKFTRDGSRARVEYGGQTARRLDNDEVRARVAASGDSPALSAAHTAADSGAASLSIGGLSTMTPYQMRTQYDDKGNPVTDPHGNPVQAWVDAVQQDVTSDLTEIMNTYVPGDLWSLMYPGRSQPTLTGDLMDVVNNTPVDGGEKPTDFYSSLATAVLAQGMAGGSDQYCAQLNGPRAATWLKVQIASSKVYQAHSQALFNLRWSEFQPDTADYLTDQLSNNYSDQIAAKVKDWCAEIDGASLDADTAKSMKAQMTDLGQYATDHQTFWALAYFVFITQPATLGMLQYELDSDLGSTDGSTLTRSFQQHVSVLTALDTSGTFAKQYIQTLQTYLATSVLPSMLDYSGDAASYELVLEYLNQFVNDNIASEDARIQGIAQELQYMLANEQAAQAIHNSIEALRNLAQSVTVARSFPIVASGFVSWIDANCHGLKMGGEFFGTLIMAGMTGLCIVPLLSSFEDWDGLSKPERANAIISVSEFGLQALSAVVTRGVRLPALWSVQGLSPSERVGAVMKILIGKEPEQLGEGLENISNSLARWIGGIQNEGAAAVAVAGEAAAAEASFAVKVFGRNLDDFMATRIGPVFILAGMGMSLYNLIEGEGGLDAAMDYLSYYSGALALFAQFGGWALAAVTELAAETIVAITGVAGCLSIACALAGLGIMIYLMVKQQKPEDPMQKFVDNYAAPQGFSVSSQCSAIDYAGTVPFNDANSLAMMGFRLGTGTLVLLAASSGAVGAGPADNGFSSVWNATTDGLGVSQIWTAIDRGDKKGLVKAFLTKTADGAVSFQDELDPGSTCGSSTVITQRWLCTPAGNATVVASNLSTMSVQVQPVTPTPASGSTCTYPPANASGYLAIVGTGVTLAPSAGNAFTLTMSGRVPGALTLQDLTYKVGLQSVTSQVPMLGQVGSATMSFAISPDLPDFLQMQASSGVITQKDGTVPTGTMASTQYTMTASNSIGSTSATFAIQVVPLDAPPAPSRVARKEVAFA